MSHAVETMFYVKETPWHGLGVKLEEAPTVSEAIVAAGLDWTVGLKDLFTGEGVKVASKATYRETDGSILGVVGPRYSPLQNVQAFNWFQPFIDSGEVSLHTAGSLNEGCKVWVLAELNREKSEIVKGDEIAKFVLLSNSHDGTTAIRVGYTPIRVVCANTMAMAHSCTESKLLRVRHTKSSAAKLEDIRGIMNNINAQFEATAEQYKYLASKMFSSSDLVKYVKIILNVDLSATSSDIKTRTNNNIEDILSRVEGEKQKIAGVEGTWWAAYNGVNEYLNYKKGRSRNNRMDALWFGSNDNKRAFDTALALAN